MFLYITLLETWIEAYFTKLSDQDIELSSTPPLQDPARSLIPLAPPLLMYTAPALHRVAEPNGCIPLYTIVLYIRYQYIMIFHYIFIIIYHYIISLIYLYTPQMAISTNFDKRQTVNQMAGSALAMVPPMARRWVPWSHFCPGGATMRWTGDGLVGTDRQDPNDWNHLDPGCMMNIDEYWWIMMSWWCCSKYAFGHSMH
jgi:hypothetical protein